MINGGEYCYNKRGSWYRIYRRKTENSWEFTGEDYPNVDAARNRVFELNGWGKEMK